MKWLLRAIGVDKFSDTTLIIVVHEAAYQGAMSASRIRVTAGDHQALTDSDARGRFQQPISLMVEQGTQKILVDLTDDSGYSVLATLSLDVFTDIGIRSEFGFREQIFQMKQKSKIVANPRVKLSIRDDYLSEDEEALFGNLSLTSWENQVMFEESVAKNRAADKALNKEVISSAEAIETSSRPTRAEHLSEITVLCAGLRGSLELHGPWDRKRACYVAAVCPPTYRKHCICIWQDFQAYDARRKPQEEIDVLKISGVQPHPGKPNVFFIIYMPKRNQKRRLAFERVDRSRDYWVELISVLVDKVRALRDMQQGKVRDPDPEAAMASAQSEPQLGRLASSPRLERMKTTGD